MPPKGKRPPFLGFEPVRPRPLRIEVFRIEERPEIASVPLHAHRFYEVLLVTGGTGTHRIGERDFAVEAGSLFFLRPGEVHHMAGLGSATGYVLLLTPDVLESVRGARAVPEDLFLFPFVRGSEPLGVTPSDLPEWSRQLEGIAAEMEGLAPGWEASVRARLTLLLVAAARLARPAVSQVAPETRPLLAAVFRFIDARYRTPISLSDVARAVDRSPAYLTDLVQRETGRTVLGWITDRRLGEARQLLLEGDEPVARIAMRVSYTDPSHFSRLFKREHGLSPQAWRGARR